MQIKNVKQTFLIFLSLAILSFSFYSYAEENSSTDKNIFLDSDQDNLSDEEEKIYGTDPQNPDTDGDSYSDSVEIKNGFNPLIPAPGDRIVKKEEDIITVQEKEKNNSANENNLTKKVSERLSKLIEEKKASASETDLLSPDGSTAKTSGLTVEEIQNAVGEVVEENTTEDPLPEISLSDIKIKKQNYSKLSEEERNDRKREDFAKYASSLFYIFSSNSPVPITSGSDITKASTSIQKTILSAMSARDSSQLNDLEKSNDLILEQIKDVEVPSELADIHIQALRLAKYSKTLKNYINPSANDPLGDMANLTKIENFQNELYIFSDELSKKIETYGVSYDDDLKQRLKTQGVILPEESSTNNNED